ncbi:hypothetical protein ASPZODRAFT_795296 [Penicilliopsis zonata CBS 506.65]|uniref:Zn(2)-C6 fungal-type domain-containing protein n=1 Tax=Penicilliopsis zonata CBS 506.65 TaxID=1073090 RepID=A0A1L9SBH9_9EURO|nr:hypothetical protein ASPZODRAFT_795296 [Penicilliopsis zonata CBS 506.65]OJJ44469.1 hypothetical protein ASPZODRAFT_795296 [Penicilliopsis zonata CBS 506.65]
MKHSRTRTGCQTCRIRRIKCDERPGSCEKCASTGRICDGYASVQLPIRKPRNATTSLLHHPGLAASLPGKSSDERWCFTFFQTQTIPMLAGCFDSHLWPVVLQMCPAEPAVCHAVTALSALHQASQQAKSGIYHAFAFKQYGRALATLRARLASTNDPQLRSVALVSCLLFMFFASIQGNLSEALLHLKQGMHILSHRHGQAARQMLLSAQNQPLSMFEASVWKLFAHLEVQSAHFDASGALKLYPTDGQLVEVDSSPCMFHSVNEAKEMLDPLLNNVFRVWTLREETDFLTLAVEQRKIQSEIMRHMAALDNSMNNSNNTKFITSEKDSRCLDIIRLHHLILYINVETILSTSEMVFDHYNPEWRECLRLARRIIDSFRAEFSASSMPILTADLGVLLPLSWITLKCRHPGLRQEALDLMAEWPHCEGFNDSVVLLQISREIIDFEMRQGCLPIPDEARVRSFTLEDGVLLIS